MATINLDIPDKLKAKLEIKIKGTDFKSIKEYVNYVLEQVIQDVDSTEDEVTYSEEEEAAVKKRLEELGYV